MLFPASAAKSGRSVGRESGIGRERVRSIDRSSIPTVPSEVMSRRFADALRGIPKASPSWRIKRPDFRSVLLKILLTVWWVVLGVLPAGLQ